MKTSNQLIIFLLVITFAAIAGTNMVLKKEYDKVDRKDPFWGYLPKEVPKFNAVKLQGHYAELVQLQPGKQFQIKIAEGWKDRIRWQVRHDTLELSFQSEGESYRYQAGDAARQPPVAYVMAPQLTAVSSSGATAVLKGWQASSWSLKQEGFKSAMILDDNQIDSLSAGVRSAGLLQVAGKNALRKATVQVSDSSRFVVEKDVFGSIRINADTLAKVQLPGALWRKITQ